MLAIVWIAIMFVTVIHAFFLIRGDLPKVLGPTVGFAFGVLLAYGALGFTFVGTNTVRTEPQLELAFIGLAVIVLNAILLFTEAVESLDISAVTGSR